MVANGSSFIAELIHRLSLVSIDGRAVLVDAEHAMLGDVALPCGVGAAVVEFLGQPRHVVHVFDQEMPAAAGRIETAQFPGLPIGLQRQGLLDALLDQVSG